MSSPPPELDLCLAALRFHPTYSGPALRFQRYEPGLRGRGVRMRVFSAKWAEDGASDAREFSADAGPTTDTVRGIPIHRTPLRTGEAKSRIFWAFERGLFHYCRSGPIPDVIQLLDVSLTSPMWLRRIKSLGVPLVYTQTMVRNPDLGWLKNFVWRQTLAPADCTVVSTETMRAALRQVGFGGRVRVIPNGVDTSRFSPAASRDERDEIRRRIQVPVSAELVVFVGGYLSPRKGVDILAAAWSKIAAQRPEAVLMLVGPTLDSFRSMEKQTAFLKGVRRSLEASGAMDRVVFAGPVSDVEAYLKSADVFVFPSRWEGMPNVVLESYGCGTASILCPFVGMSREFGQPGQHYIESRHDANDLAERTVGLLEDEGLRRSLAQRARKWVTDGLGVERSLDSYAELYRELARASGRR